MSDIAIRVENLSKLYHIGATQKRHDTLRDAIVYGLRGPIEHLSSFVHRSSPNGDERRRTSDEYIWALKDVSFEVKRGEVVGIIGRNGAGKSTLLKILSRITEPTKGRAIIDGRVGSLLEVGTGFHPELTGRENIYLNGAILGMKRAEIDRKFDEIVAFAEIEKFLDTPVKHYSSGMYVRLAFAVAAHLEPEILLVDEVLAVGDAAFQKKCLGKMGDVAKEGRTVLFVSHNMAAVNALCRNGLLLEHGSISVQGPAQQALRRYLDNAISSESYANLLVTAEREKGCNPIIERIDLLDGHHLPAAVFGTGQTMTVRLMVNLQMQVGCPVFGLGVDTMLGQRVFSAATYFQTPPPPEIRGRCEVECTIPGLPLVPGRYSVNLSAGHAGDGLMDHVRHAIWFEVIPGDYFETAILPTPTQGPVVVRAHWSYGSEAE